MPKRYIVTPRTSAEGAFPESADITLVVRLDRGAVVDTDAKNATRLEQSGWRVKEIRDAHTIRIFDYAIDTDSGAVSPKVPRLKHSGRAGDEGGRNHLIKLAGPVQESWLAVLADRGVQVVEAIGPLAYYVRGDSTTVNGLRALPFVEWAGPLTPELKVNPVLLAGNPKAKAGKGLGPIEAVDIGVLVEGDFDAIAALVAEVGGKVLHIGPKTGDAFRSIRAQLPTDGLGAVAARDDVRWIDAVRTPLLEDERSSQIVLEDLNGVAAPNTGPVVGYAANLTALGVDGTGVTIAICDTGVDTNDAASMHADLAGRFAFAVDATGAAVADGDTNGHGTHVAGIAAGNGASGDTDPQGFVLGQGVASAAQVGFVRFNGSVQQRVQESARQGADVMNNSWAMNGDDYSADDRTVDLGVRDADPANTDQTPLVIVFSAGNSGPGAGSVTKNPKNAILVGNALTFRPGEGAADDIRGIANNSSRGPAADGRLLPTVTAPGTNIVSARSNADTDAVAPGVQRPDTAYTDTGGGVHNNHTQKSGTSMASPHVAGACAILIDWWRQTRNGRTPSPALLKAFLIATTESAQGGPGVAGGLGVEPNNNVGWGRVSIENALLQAPDSDRGPKLFVDQRHAFSATGQEYTIRVAAVDPTRPLRVALTWSDAAAAVGANPALVNDLDLEVLETATTTLFRGNVFAGGFSTAGGAADTLNTAEVVAIQNPNGVYEVTVVASAIAASARTDIATPWQDFALVIDNAEVPAANPVSVVSVLDRSGSMQVFGYIDITRQTSRQFIDLMSVDDSVGVVSFGDSGDEESPGTGAPALIVGQTTRDAAKVAVDGIGFGGCTFMGAGIQTAGAMLAGSGTRRAMLLLSDGYDNKGCDEGNPAKPSALDAAAALPADLPIYSCAMGPASDQALLGQLATDTNGRYYFMPTIDDLFEIYNFIRGQVTSDGIIINESSVASVSQVSGWVDGCAQAVLFTVAWRDPSLRYVSRDPKANSDISVRLRSPGGRWLPRSATEFVRNVGNGYVSFKIEDPQPGLWTVEVATARSQHTPYTVGGFVRSPLALSLQVPSLVFPGQPIDVTAVVSDRKGPLQGVKVRATVSAPRASIGDLVTKYASRLSRIKLPPALRRDGAPDKARVRLAQLVLLRDKLVADGDQDILAPVVHDIAISTRAIASPRDWLTGATPVTGAGRGAVTNPGIGRIIDPRNIQRPQQRGVSRGRFDGTRIPGSYNVIVTATGFSPTCGTRFVRHDMASVVVGEKRRIG
jgi:subtilisin family serine protease/Mg-chelatase subunit ChlD